MGMENKFHLVLFHTDFDPAAMSRQHCYRQAQEA